MRNLKFQRYEQQGAALIISLIFLLLLTLLGVGAMQSSTLQERMAGNARDYNAAFQAAEFGLQQAELLLSSTSFSPSTFVGGAAGQVAQLSGATIPIFWETYDWNGASLARSITSGTDVLSTRIVIEQFASEENKDVSKMMSAGKAGSRSTGGGDVNTTIYRITSRGQGQSQAATVILQETFQRNEKQL